MGFSIKKIGRKINKAVVKVARAAAPIVAMTPGIGTIVGGAATGAFAAVDAAKAAKQTPAATFEGANARDAVTVANSGIVFPSWLPRSMRAAGTSPQAPSTDPQTVGLATPFDLSSLGRINPLVLAAVGFGIFAFLFFRRK